MSAGGARAPPSYVHATSGKHRCVQDDQARELLTRERERIEQALADYDRERGGEEEELSQVDQHPADTGSDLFQREHEAGIMDRLRADLAAIERAEGRLGDGTYGQSVESGEPIPDERLEAMPWAERTVEEQSRLEAAG